MRHLAPLAARHRFRSKGFSLLEILISIIILSIGLLGVAGLQASAIKANREAIYQSIAVRYGRELAEMMKGNPATARLTVTSSNPYLVTYSSASATLNTTVPQTTNCWTTPCTNASDLAQWQIRDWLYRLNFDLPGARVAICFDTAPYDNAGLPQWDCTNTGTVTHIKIGWTRGAFSSQKTGSDAFDKATKPAIVVPISMAP